MFCILHMLTRSERLKDDYSWATIMKEDYTILVSIMIRHRLTHWIDSLTPKLCMKMFGSRAGYVQIKLLYKMKEFWRYYFSLGKSLFLSLRTIENSNRHLEHCTRGDVELSKWSAHKPSLHVLLCSVSIAFSWLGAPPFNCHS